MPTEILVFGSRAALRTEQELREVTMLKRVDDLFFDVDEVEQAVALTRDAWGLPGRHEHV
jgi:hypothetical protein